MKGFPPNTNPEIFSLLAIALGVITTSDFDDYELNSIGNWIILFGQYLLTYAAQMQLIEARIDKDNINVNSKQYKNGGSPYTNNYKSNQNQRDDVEYIFSILNKIEEEFKNIKKTNK